MDALRMWRRLCRRNSSRSFVVSRGMHSTCPNRCHLADLTSSLMGDIDSGDKAPCSRCDAASECRRSGVGGDGGMRPGDLFRPLSPVDGWFSEKVHQCVT